MNRGMCGRGATRHAGTEARLPDHVRSVRCFFAFLAFDLTGEVDRGRMVALERLGLEVFFVRKADGLRSTA